MTMTPTPNPTPPPRIDVRLSSVILAVSGDCPHVVCVDDRGADALPFGPLEATADRTLELAVRRVVREQTGIELGYVEQLYTFGDLGRAPAPVPAGRVISIAYLALVREQDVAAQQSVTWRDCYALFPWEDWRAKRPDLLDQQIEPMLREWAGMNDTRRERTDIAFGLRGTPWDDSRALERYELLYEVGLVAEHFQDRQEPAERNLGRPMTLDHRRMVATALGRLRGKLAYRPVVFELVPSSFTLGRLQEVVEALGGRTLHKPNFRRLVEQSGLVEGTGEFETRTGGRPAELFRFRREVLRERPAPGVVPPAGR